MGTDATSAPAVTGLAVPPGTSVDPKLALALNVHASPGVYALLLGSGISIASGVKTGWGIVEDLVARVATAHDPDNPEAGAQAAADPEGWWAKNFTDPLGYSSLLEAVAPTPSARQAILDPYFVPEDGEEATDKAPTAAHRAIARMVKRGSFRVILTTNFDRLMERALEGVGLSPQVVSRPEQIDAIKPLPHSQITIIKLHGDYADLQQRNTVTELDTYPEAQQDLLNWVLDNYGLVACGWSADWDKALVRAVEGTRSRRYPLFWSTYGALGTEAKRLTAQHSAAVLQGMSADELFTDLERRLEALDRLSAPPISRDMAVAQLKKALPDPVKRIELNDLVMQTAFAVVSASTRERHPLTGPVFAESVQRYRADSDILLHLLANGVFHDDGTHDELWVRSLDRLARIRNSYTGSFNDVLEGLRHYPSLLATWTIGVAAVLARREELLATTMTRPTWTTLWGRTEQQPPRCTSTRTGSSPATWPSWSRHRLSSATSTRRAACCGRRSGSLCGASNRTMQPTRRRATGSSSSPQ